MKEERNALQKEVFPKLRKLCMEHGFRFQAIDLRWGVSEEAGLDQQTMKICLEEIERSQKVSPKPNFIVLLGDRYGWRPLPYEIPADEFEEIKSIITDEDDRRFLLWEGDVLEEDQLKKREGWYCRDENAVPPVYCLKPRLVDCGEDASDDEIKEARDLEYKDWEDVEKRLKSILLNAINELDWDTKDLRRFKYESSATEQEIIKGVLNLPEDGSLSEEHVFSFMRTIKDKKLISFDDYSKDFFDFTTSGTIDASAEIKLGELKAKIDDKLTSSNIFDYETEWEGKGVNKQHIEKLCDDVYSSLEKVINEQIDEFEDKDPLDIEIEAHKEFGKERCKFFIGREDNRSQIKNYLKTPNTKPLIVYGESGSGKSALMAQTVKDLRPEFYKVPVDNVIVRFIGTTPESSDMRSLLEILSRQITRIYGEDDSNIPTEYNDLVQDFKDRLDFATAEKPIFIFLDALDQLSDSDSAHNLTWLPDELPENAYIVISTLKNNFQSSLENRMSIENTVEVLPLEKNEGRTILGAWFKDNKRKLTDEQENEIIGKFEVKGLPLYLKLVFEESKLWKSYTPVPELESDIKWMINNLFERLSQPENHGEMLVSRSLGYLSAAKNGLTEDEMLDILDKDKDVFNLTTKFHEPTEDKLPVAIWSRLYFDLEPYLTERSADETSLMTFYHRQLGEVAREKYLNDIEKKSRHQLIAEYFYKQDLYFEQDEERVYNVRKVSELPYQETYGECWKYLEEILCDLRFVEAKCAVGKTYELIKDYNLALNMHPDAQDEQQKRLEYKKRIDKYINDLIDYAENKIDQLDIIPSVKILTEEELKKEKERIIDNPSSTDIIKAFYQFIISQSHLLKEYGSSPGFVLQRAYDSANSGPVMKSAKNIINEDERKLILKRWLPEYNAHNLLIKTLITRFFRKSLAVTPDGKILISGTYEAEAWDLKVGEKKKGLEREIGTSNKVLVTANGKTAFISGPLGLTIWDIESGQSSEILKSESAENKDNAGIDTFDITPNGKIGITVSENIISINDYINEKIACVWDLKTGKLISILQGHTDEINAAAISANGKIAVTGSTDKTVRVWNLKTSENCILKGHNGGISAVSITPDASIAVTASYDRTLRIWDLKNKKHIKTLNTGVFTVKEIDITADGKKAVTISGNNCASVWDLEKQKLIKILKGHRGRIFAVAISPDGVNAITGCEYDNINVWDLEKGYEPHEINRYSIVLQIVFTPDSKKVISRDFNDAIIVWDYKTAMKLHTLEEYMPGPIMVVSHDNKKLITGSLDSISVWNLENGEKIHEINIHNEGMLFDVTKDCKRAVTGIKGHSHLPKVHILDIETGRELYNISRYGGIIATSKSTKLTPDNTKLITGDKFGKTIIWDLESGKKLQSFTNTIGSHVFINLVTPDGKTLISGTYNDKIYIWNIKTGEQLIEPIKIDYYPEIAITPDGNKLIIYPPGSIWDIKTGKQIHTFSLSGFSNSLEVTLDGKYALIGSNNLIHVLDIENGEEINFSFESGGIGEIFTQADGHFIFNTENKPICSYLANMNVGYPFVTATRIWLFGEMGNSGAWDKYIKVNCPWCRECFKLETNMINLIKKIESQFTRIDGLIANEAWEDPRLISECPECHQKIKFNPFIVDNKPKSKWKFWK